MKSNNFSFNRIMLNLFNKIKNKLALIMSVALALGIGISLPKLNLIYICTIIYWGFKLITPQKLKNLIHSLDFSVSIFLLFFIWSLVSCIWSPDTYDGIRQSAFLLILLTSTLLISEDVNDDKKAMDLLKITGIVIWLHFLISVLEMKAYFRWPISPFSEYVEYFGRKAWFYRADGSVETHYQIPTSFYWNPNYASVVSLISMPFFYFRKSYICNFLGGLLTSLVILFALNRIHFILFPLELIFSSAILFFLTRNFKQVAFKFGLTFLGAALSYSYFSINSSQANLGELKHSLQSLEAFLSKTKNYKEQLPVNLKESISIEKFRLYDKDGISERLIIQEQLLKNISPKIIFGLGGGALKNQEYHFRGKLLKLTAPHNAFLEIAIEYGIIPMLLIISWMILFYKRLICFAFSCSLQNKNINAKLEIHQYFLLPYIASFPFFLLGSNFLDIAYYFFPFCLYFAFGVVLYKLFNAQTFVSVNQKSL